MSGICWCCHADLDAGEGHQPNCENSTSKAAKADKPKRQRKGVKTNRKELALKMAKATDLYIEGCPPRRIAPLVDRSPTSVVRWMRKMKITPPEVKVQELWEANHIKEDAYRIHQQCREVEVVAMRLETPLHIVRAAIYLAEQERRNGGKDAGATQS